MENFQIDSCGGFQIKIFMWKVFRLIFSCGAFSDQYIHVESFQINKFIWRVFRSINYFGGFSD